MQRIITISREFGSGGRELGKRLADALGFDYYDREIISAIAKDQGLNEQYVEHTLDSNVWQTIPLTFRHSFTVPMVMQTEQTNLMLSQRRIIDRIARFGKDFVIVGRNADILLQQYHPFNLFVCADLDAKVTRCTERAEIGEALSRKEIEQNIKRIDKSRARTRSILSDSEWGNRKNYHLIVNTTNWDIKSLSKSVACVINSWYDSQEAK